MDARITSAVVVLAAFGACALAGALATGTRRPVLSAAIALLLLPLPILAPLSLARAYAGLGAVVCGMRVVEAWRVPPPVLPWPIAFVLPVDLPSVRRAPPRLAWEVAVRALVHAIVAAVGVVLVVGKDATPAPLVVGWAGGVLAVYGAVELLTSTVRALLFAFGFESPPVQRDPVLARSVGEFWSDRWNRAVGAWLRRHVFWPTSRRLGVRAGAIAAFCFSALFHAYLVLVATGPEPALVMAAFFGVQAIATSLEPIVHLERWPRALAHLWALGWVLGASPLFVVPMLLCFGVRFD